MKKFFLLTIFLVFPYFLNAGKVTIIIDDIGKDIKTAIKIWEINRNITLSIIPFFKDAKKISFYAELNSLPVMLHFPMEPENFHNDRLNRYYLLTKFDKKKFIEVEEMVLKMLLYYQGINNHMGSKLTENERCMRWFFEEIKGKNLFFIDSRTTPFSVAYDTAKRVGIPAGKRDIFLDNEKDEGKILENLEKLFTLSYEKGYAIGIGHPYKSTIKALSDFLKKHPFIDIISANEGVKFYEISRHWYRNKYNEVNYFW